MKTTHTHTFKPGRGSVDVCACGQFRHNEKAGPAIVEQRARHTPGPWSVEYVAGADIEHAILPSHIPGHWHVDPLPGNNGVSCVAHTFGPDMEANARLIAAAPDLLAALQMVCDSGVALADPIERAMLDALGKAKS